MEKDLTSKQQESEVQEKENNELTVALLFSNLQEAKEISQVFRHIGVIPHVYTDLSSFWYETLQTPPSLTVVDVRMMSEGEFVFKDHPLIRDEQLPVAFFYTDETSPLVYSTFEIYNLGLIRKSGPFRGQIKSILKRFNKVNEWTSDNKKLKAAADQAKAKLKDKKVDNFILALESYKEKDFYQNKLDGLVARITRELELSGDFNTAIEKGFESFNYIAEYTVFELNPARQKLVSSTMMGKKFRVVPPVFLGQECENGIELFAQNMASQVVLDLMGGELMALGIKGTLSEPERIIFIRGVDEVFLDRFNWESLETSLSGLYGRSLAIQAAKNSINSSSEPWNLFTELDQMFYSSSLERANEDAETAVIDIDFTSIVELVKNKKNIRFYWKNFFQEFISRFEKQFNYSLKCYPYGIERLVVVLDAKNSDDVFSKLKSYVHRYPYWRYFDNSEVVLAYDMKPVIKMVPVSARAYLAHIEDPALIRQRSMMATNPDSNFADRGYISPRFPTPTV